MVSPSARREAVGWLQTRGTSLRRACRVVGLSTAMWRYQRRPNPTNDRLLARLQAHASERSRFGYRRLHVLVGREGLAVNHKRLYRVYRAAGLQVRRRRRKRHARGACALAGAEPASRAVVDGLYSRYPHGWPRLSHAQYRRRFHAGVRRHRSRSLLAGPACRARPRSPPAAIGLPQTIVVDNGPEFAGRTLDAWAYARGVTLRFIRPGKPIENAYVESFNGKFRDECLNEHWFVNLADAKTIIEAWRVDYNTVRPHSSLDGATPDHFATTTEGARRLTPARPDKENEDRQPEALTLSP